MTHPAEARRRVPVLTGVRVTLRPPAPEDAEAVRRIGMHPEVMLGFGEVIEEWREATPAEAEALIAGMAPDPDKVEWAIAVHDGFIGTVRLHAIDDTHGTAAYAVGILSPDHLGKGYGTEVTRLVLAYAFGVLALESVTVRVLDGNARATACYAKCGFTFGHREPHAVQLRGVWRDDVIMRLEVERYRLLAPTWSEPIDRPGL